MNPIFGQQEHQPRVGPLQADTDQSATVRAQTSDAVDPAPTRMPRPGTQELPTASRDASCRARGLQWVRPTDLLTGHSAAAAGRGLDLQVKLARRARTTTVTALRALRGPARRLPLTSSFGRSDTPRSATSRQSAGMSPMGR